MGGRSVTVTVILIAVAMATALLGTTVAISGDGPRIQPGAPAGGCTLNFVFDGTGSLEGEVYIGTAGHCVGVGQAVSNGEVGPIGTVVYDNDGVTDFALIDVDDSKHDQVDAQLRGHPGTPTGVANHAETSLGDLLIFSGYGTGFTITETTRENRTGILVSHDETEYTADGPVVPGDSGGPIVHQATGKALGIVSHFNLAGIPPTTDEGPTVEHILGELHADGFPVTLRTA